MDTRESPLDNPIWNSLTTGHAHLAEGDRLARRYRSEIGPLSGLSVSTTEAWADLAALVLEGDVAVLLVEGEPELPSGWELVRGGDIVQMICAGVPVQVKGADEDAIMPLGPADFPEMLALATLTEPGPFRANTGVLGGFVGIRVGGRLAAMAGRRLHPEGFVEVSAVCTHPDMRGHGYAKTLVAAVAQEIHAEGLTPFLTSFEANAGAIRIYDEVGFRLRRRFQLAVVRPPGR